MPLGHMVKAKARIHGWVANLCTGQRVPLSAQAGGPMSMVALATRAALFLLLPAACCTPLQHNIYWEPPGTCCHPPVLRPTPTGVGVVPLHLLPLTTALMRCCCCCCVHTDHLTRKAPPPPGPVTRLPAAVLSSLRAFVRRPLWHIRRPGYTGGPRCG